MGIDVELCKNLLRCRFGGALIELPSHRTPAEQRKGKASSTTNDFVPLQANKPNKFSVS